MVLRYVIQVSLAIVLSLSFTCVAIASDLDVLDKQRRTRPEPLSRPPIRITEDAGKHVYDQSLRFQLSALHVDGATVFTELQLLVPYISLYGTQVSFDQMLNIAEELTKKYRDAGYLLSRVVLPAQEIDPITAQVRFTAIEGYLTAIEYTGDPELVARFKSYFSSIEQRLLAKRPLKHADFEREMLLIQGLPGIEVASHFKEAQVSGGSILVIELKQDILDGSLGWGNTGTESSGPGLASASVGINTLPAIGSKTTVSYSQANDINEYMTWQVGHSHQFSNGLTVSASYAFSKSPKPDSDFARAFDYENQSKTFSAGVSYPFIRGRDMNLSAELGYEHRNSQADLMDERFTADRLRNLSLGLNFDFSDEWGGVTQILPSLTKGLSIFNATDKDPDSASPAAGAEFIKANIYLSRNQQLPNNFSILAAAETQFSDTALASYNLYSLGGSQFGRGYDPGVIEGDNAFAASFEPRWTHYLNDEIALQPFAFIDWGSVWASNGIDGAPDEENLSSVGVGIRFWGHAGKDYFPDFNISAFIGKPLKRAGGDPTSERVVVQFTLLF